MTDMPQTVADWTHRNALARRAYVTNTPDTLTLHFRTPAECVAAHAALQAIAPAAYPQDTAGAPRELGMGYSSGGRRLNELSAIDTPPITPPDKVGTSIPGKGEPALMGPTIAELIENGSLAAPAYREIKNSPVIIEPKVPADDTWIAWEGGPCPVEPDQMVRVWFRGNDHPDRDAFPASRWFWGRLNQTIDGSDIIAYQVA